MTDSIADSVECAPSSSSTSTTATSSCPLRICDVSVTVQGLPLGLCERFAALMRPFEGPPDADLLASTLEVRSRPNNAWAIIREGHEVACFGDAELLLKQLEWHAVSIALQGTSRYTAIHGAALSRDSSLALLLADSGAGKTTLTLGLMRRGWLPLADDVALIDVETLAVRPFPRCFHADDAAIELAGAESFVEWPGAVREYARPLQWAPGGLQPTSIFVVERCLPCATGLRAMTLAEAAAAVAHNSIRCALSKSQVASVAVRMAAGLRGGGHLKNGRLEDTLDLIEAVSQQERAHYMTPVTS